VLLGQTLEDFWIVVTSVGIETDHFPAWIAFAVSEKLRSLKTSPCVPGNKNQLHDSSAKVSIWKNAVQQNQLVAKVQFQHESL